MRIPQDELDNEAFEGDEIGVCYRMTRKGLTPTSR